MSSKGFALIRDASWHRIELIGGSHDEIHGRRAWFRFCCSKRMRVVNVYECREYAKNVRPYHIYKFCYCELCHGRREIYHVNWDVARTWWCELKEWIKR